MRYLLLNQSSIQIPQMYPTHNLNVYLSIPTFVTKFTRNKSSLPKLVNKVTNVSANGWIPKAFSSHSPHRREARFSFEGKGEMRYKWNCEPLQPTETMSKDQSRTAFNCFSVCRLFCPKRHSLRPRTENAVKFVYTLRRRRGRFISAARVCASSQNVRKSFGHQTECGQMELSTLNAYTLFLKEQLSNTYKYIHNI